MNRLILSLLGAGLVLGLVTHAAAQDEAARDRAREHFTSGVARYEAGDYQGALEQFQEAYRIAPHPSVRVNMANCYEQLGRPLEALHHFEGFLAESENPSPQQRREVQAAVRRLQGRLGELRLNIAPDGATVTIDNAQTRRAPVLEGIMLEEGNHTLEVRMDGFETNRREVEITGGETQRVSVRLERPSADTPAVAATDPEPEEEEPALTDPVETGNEGETSDADGAMADAEPIPSDDGGGGWSFQLTAPVLIAGITTLVFAAGAITAGVLALDYNAQSDEAFDRFRAPGATAAEMAQAREDGLSAGDSANTASILSDVFLIGTIAAGAATIFFVIVEGMDSSDDEMAARPGTFAVSGAATDQGGAVTLLGRF